jgi:flagellar protein FlaG
MDLDVKRIQAAGMQQAKLEEQAKKPPPEAPKRAEIKNISEDELQRYIDDIVRASGTFNRKLSYSINRDLGEVVVKVIDRETDKVIKEIPPAEIQRLHARIKELVGILFDQTI